MTHPIVERAFPVEPEGLLPEITADSQPYWEALARGELVAQRCAGCGRHRHPIAPVCPYCADRRWAWSALSGEAAVFSWVRYRRGYLPEFADVMPYVVVTAQLREGPRLFGRLIGDGRAIAIGQPLRLVIERWPNGRCVPAFRIANPEDSR